MIGRLAVGTVPLAAPDQLRDAFRPDPVAALLGDGGEVAAACAEVLAENGWTVHHAEHDNPPQEVDAVLWFAPDAPRDWDVSTGALSEALLTAGSAAPALLRGAADGRTAFVAVSRLDGEFGASGKQQPEAAVLGGIPGLVRTLRIEAEAVLCRALDFAPELPARRCAELALAELHDSEGSLTETGYAADGDRRTVAPLGPADATQQAADAEPGPGDLFVVTGGARGVTAGCAVELARRYGSGVLLIGRTPLLPEPEWARDVPEAELKHVIVERVRASGGTPAPRDVEAQYRELVAQREIRSTVETVEACGAHAEYLSVDVTNTTATVEALAPYRDRITGVVHGAGVLSDRAVVEKRPQEVARVLSPKLGGLRSVLAAVDMQRVRYVNMFGSVAGLFGNRGQADYAAANAALSAVACSLQRNHPSTAVAAINWGAWNGGMVSAELARMFETRGVELIPFDTGVRMFADQFTTGAGGDVVRLIGPSAPLSARPREVPEPFTVERALDLADEPVLRDHVIGGSAVLPAAVVIGGLLNAAQRRDSHVTCVHDFAVLSGVALDRPVPRLRMSYTQADGGRAEVLAVDQADRPRYRAVLGTELGPPGRIDGLPPFDGGSDVDPYADGTLFHGPSLRGIDRVLADDERLVLRCCLGTVPLARGAYATETYRPAAADLLLQAVLVWVRRRFGEASLPSAIGGVEPHAALPDGEPFAVVVEGQRTASGTARCTATACAADGTVLLRFSDVEAVPSAGLRDKFAQADPKGDHA